MNGDSSSPPASRLTRTARTQKTIFRGNVDGRVRQAAPIPPPLPPPSNLAGALFVGSDDPGLDGGYDFWLDTTPVAGNSTFLTFENYGTHEGKPENGIGATLVGTGNLWQDNSDLTYATRQYGGFEDPWGHPYARIVELPLTRAQANQVTDVIVSWRARIVEFDPTAPEYYKSEMAISPRIRWGQGEEGYSGASYYSLSGHAWDGANEQSLYYGTNPSAPWEETYLPADGSWKNFQERYTPIYTVGTGATVQDILCNELPGGGPYRNTPTFGGTQDHLRLYVMIEQDSFWSEDKFAVSDIKIELVGLGPPSDGKLKVNVGDRWVLAAPDLSA